MNELTQSNQSITTGEIIEILPVSLLESGRPLVKELRALAHSLGLEFGWHYLLDLVWIIDHLGNPAGKRIMDAGAGTGIIQWYLAGKSADVISVDRESRANLAYSFRSRYRVSGLRPTDLAPYRRTIVYNFQHSSNLLHTVRHQARDLVNLSHIHRTPGHVFIYNQDLKNLGEITDNSLDAVVSVSALEHNYPTDLPLVIKELMRVLKPGGLLLATLGGSKGEDWFHEPSSGWCYSEASLRRLFDFHEDVRSNFCDYDELFTKLKNNQELQANLAQFYFRSGNNGMPWGKWDPKYQSVGICKVKAGIPAR